MMVGWHWIVDRRVQVSCIGEIGEMARQKLALYNYTPPPICMNGGRHAAPVVVPLLSCRMIMGSWCNSCIAAARSARCDGR